MADLFSSTLVIIVVITCYAIKDMYGMSDFVVCFHFTFYLNLVALFIIFNRNVKKKILK